MRKTMRLGLMSILLSLGALAQAESYRTFVDVLGSNMVAITISQGNVIKDEVKLNGKTLEEVRTANYNSSGEIKVVSNSGKVILHVPAESRPTDWATQEVYSFSDGDTRVLKGDLKINGKSVSKLVEVFATE